MAKEPVRPAAQGQLISPTSIRWKPAGYPLDGNIDVVVDFNTDGSVEVRSLEGELTVHPQASNAVRIVPGRSR